MRTIGGDDIARALTYPALVEALEAAFRSEIEVPVRHHHRIAHPRGDATLLLMPAWAEEFLGCKLVTVFPGNAELEKPSVYGAYLLMSGRTGEPLAVIDGRPLTAWRTAAASALAATYLARQDAAHLVMIGAGALAPHLVRAHASVRPIRRVSLWNRTRQRAETLAFPLVWDGFEATVGDDLERLVRDADIVCCATLSTAPLVHGRWLKPGTHVDLVGSFRPDMREADDDVLRRPRRSDPARHHRRGRHPRRPVRSLPRQGRGPRLGRGDHLVQIRRHRARGFRRRHAAVAASRG